MSKMEYVNKEAIEKALKDYPAICKALSETKKLLDNEKLNPQIEQVVDIYLGRLAISELFFKMKESDISKAAPIDKDIITNQINSRSEELKNQLPTRVSNGVIFGVPVDMWVLKNDTCSIKGIEKHIEEKYTIPFNTEQKKAAKLLTEFADSYNKLSEYMQQRGDYFPNIFDRGAIPLMNNKGDIKPLDIIQKIKS